MKRRYQKFTAVSTAITLAMSMVLTSSLNVSAASENDSNSSSNSNEKYEIYPKPQKIEYTEGDYILDRNINVVYEDGIDYATRNRLQEIAKLKDIKISESKDIKKGSTNILVGTIDNNDKTVDDYINKKNISNEELFKKTDSYILNSDNNTIAVLGKDNDSSFYGLTTLYHIVKQIDSYTIANFNIEDYADIVSRGFIEGYYGEPWSTEDRVNLMNWSGYYKLNSYFYAPKDDPKHNKNWREEYTKEEIEKKIKPLAEAGNNSKTRFVYALHPFMNSPMAKPSDNPNEYEKDLEILKKKFKQVIDAGVRQIAILADDAEHWGNQNYVTLLNDMTDWLKQLQKQEKYKDLKTTLPFCTQEYMYNGEEYYKQFPKEVQIVMTGGKVWGEVTDQFTSTFTQKAGRGPYMWINWPCTDNSKKHLIMGGYSEFLQPGVNPKNIEGIVLNPMQQSEPSKVAIFGNADYSWNIWNSKEEADQAWNDSFKYVDHNSAVENEASNALRELSKHMINQAMDDRVVKLEESVELKKLLNDFKNKLNKGTINSEDIEKIEKEFTVLKEATELFDKQAGDKNLKKQMEPWIECWKDTTEAVLQYMKALRAVESDNATTMVNAYSLGNKAFNDSRKHGFRYIDHTQYAEVGVQHIVPFIKSLDSYLSKKVAEVSDPTLITKTFISDVFKNPEQGLIANIFDENDKTSAIFENPGNIENGNYFGVEFNRPIDVNSIRIVTGNAKRHFFNSKLEYRIEGNDEWNEVNNEIYSRPEGSTEAITVDNLKLEKVKAIRLVSTSNNNGEYCWLEVKSIDINKNSNTTSTVKEVGVKIPTNDNIKDENKNNKLEYIIDGNKETLAWMSNDDTHSSEIKKDTGVQIDFNKFISIDEIKVIQDNQDKIDNLTIKYQVGNEWKDLGTPIDTIKGNQDELNVLSLKVNHIETKAIRILSTNDVNTWWRLREVEVIESSNKNTVTPVGVQIGNHDNINEGQKNNKFDYIVDGDKETLAWMTNKGDNEVIKENTGVEIDLGKSTSIKEIKITQGPNDIISNLTIKYKNGKDEWSELGTINNASKVSTIDGENIEATAIQILSTNNTDKWWQLAEVEVIENPKSTAANVISNIDNHNFKASVGKEKSILTGEQITLKSNEYIGIDLKEIKAITNIDLKNKQNLSENNISLQISKNGKVWKTINPKELKGEKARYVSLVNNSLSEVPLNIESLTINTLVIGKMGELVSSDIRIESDWGDSRNNGNAFDGDMNTKTKFGGSPVEGNSIVYSFGQEIDVKSLRFYVSDNEKDFLRDAEIYLSKDGMDWENAVFTIGDGQTDSNRESTIVNQIGNHTDSTYPNVRYVGKDDINRPAKYLKIKITADYPNRAIILNEIMVNNGDYISPENNQAFTGTIETRGNMPSNMLDKNISTSYIGSEKNGHITYDLSNGEGINAFRFVQIGEATGATVTAELFDENAKNGEKVTTVDVGKLDQAINEFNVPSGKTLLSVKVSWGEKIPQIAEFITLTRNKEEEKPVDKTKLIQLIESTPEDYENWTRSSQENYKNVIEVAKEVCKSTYASQASVDSAISGICQAIKEAEKKGNVEALEKALAEKIKNNNIYTAVSYAAYESALNKIEDALKDKYDISVNEANKLLSTLEKAKSSLVYSMINREIAEMTIRSYDESISKNYTKESMANWTESYNTLKALIDKDKNEERVKPELLAKATNAYNQAKNNLVYVGNLKALIREFERMSGKGYTEDSFNAYKEAVESSRGLLINGTKAEVEAAILSIQSAKEQLQTNENYLEDVADRIETMSGDYTSESYDAFKKAYDAVQSANPNDENYERLIKELQNAEKNLVSTTRLSSIVDQFKTSLEKDIWTISYANKVNELLQVANNLFVNGTREEIDSVIKQLESLYKEQVICAEGVKEYQDSIEKKNASAYTPESYAEYEKAYNALMALNPKDVTTEEFISVKEAYELAVANLVLLDVPGQGGIGNEGNQGNQGNGSDVRPEGGNDPSNDNSSSNGNNSSNGNGSTSGNANVQTGDNSIFGMIFVAISALSLLVYTNMTKRRN